MNTKPPISKVALSLYFVGLLWAGLGVLTFYIVNELSHSRISEVTLGGRGDLALVFGAYAYVLQRFLEGLVTILLGVVAQKVSNNAWNISRGKTDA